MPESYLVPEGLDVFYGDLHSHCDVGYGHGTLDEAYRNARLSLDFVAITPHAHWHDLPSPDDERLGYLRDYHLRGFERTRDQWDRVLELATTHHEPGSFVTFVAFEWHSMQYGDHNVYFRGASGEVLRAADLPALREAIRTIRTTGGDAIAIPHHIGYRPPGRGIEWSAYTEEVSPVVEAMSMHGAAESGEGPFPYLHTMGPRDVASTYQHGLALGHRVGIIGSSDHHSGHPGSYGHGRLAVWADELTREGIWAAIQARRTYALSGGDQRVALRVGDHFMGDVAPATPVREVRVEVVGSGPVDSVELLYRNRVVERRDAGVGRGEPTLTSPVRTHLEVGWAEVGVPVRWEVAVEVEGGRLIGVDPRFRGLHVVAPQDMDEREYAVSEWSRTSSGGARFTTRTEGNVNSATPGMQGLALDIEGDERTVLVATFNGHEERIPLASLVAGSQTGRLGGFLAPAWSFSRAVGRAERTVRMELEHRPERPSDERDWYTVRVRQVDGQAAWTSPVWVEA